MENRFAVRTKRLEKLKSELQTRILVLDGAMGTSVQNRNLVAEDFGGEAYDGCNEYLVITRPDVVTEIHESFLDAGADIVETNTFGGTALVLDEFGLGEKAYDINFAAARLARKAADRFSTEERYRFVAGSIGPTTKAISVTGGVTFDELIEQFYHQAVALYDGDVDYFLIETCQDTRNIKAALLGIERLFSEKGDRIPVAVSGTIEPMGTMLAGQTVEALYAALENHDLLYLGLNCATGPEFMTDHIRSLAATCRFPVACVPNAGLPDEEGRYLDTPGMIGTHLKRFIDAGWINLVGGCCGTTPDYIAELARIVRDEKPRQAEVKKASFLSGVDFLEVTDEVRPVLVGERTNSIGSRKFKRLIAEGKFEEASDIARAQVKKGAQIVDFCLANPDRDEFADMKEFLEIAVKKVRAPMMIDSTDDQVVEMALTYSQGKAIINSINLEDGEERFAAVCPLAKKYGAALVVGTIDDDPEQGMGVTKERKLEIARREFELLTQKYGIPAEDIYWDPLVFPCATGDEQYVGSAPETIEAIRLLKEEFPGTKTVLGISNVSFGLPPAGREVLNSVFLNHCVRSGLDLAIVNSEKLERFTSISEEEVKLADDLLFGRTEDPVAAFAAFYRDKKVISKDDRKKLPLDERLSNYILEGSKDGLVEDLDEKMKTTRPLDIINGPLMKGMDEVGRLFNSNQLIVAEVLQSAEAMKAAVAHLENFMDKKDTANRGRVVLATVKGDVHDIGKNLVEIIFKNNGFEVINLGIKVLPETLIQAVREHTPDIVGLSGLLVKSAQQMVVTADDFKRAGVDTPMLVGGAALSGRFVNLKISNAYSGTVAYAKDAMSGLELAKRIVKKDEFEKLKEEIAEQKRIDEQKTSQKTVTAPTMGNKRSNEIEILSSLPQPPDLDRHIIRERPIDQIWNFINPLMLYGRHLGMKGKNVRKLVEASTHVRGLDDLYQEDPKGVEIWRAVEAVKEEYRQSEIMQPNAVYQFFKAAGAGNSLHLFEKEQLSQPKVSFEFSRQRRDDGLCLADYTAPLEDGIPHDTVALFVTTVGQGVRELAEKLKNDGDYLKSHIVQALAIESAEAYAELLHTQLRKAWGIADPIDMTMMERFQAKYRGKRYSFGYPACPRLDDQTQLFAILKPEEIGVQLTDEFMMDPEATVSAIAFHHPQASYFSVGSVEDNR